MEKINKKSFANPKKSTQQLLKFISDEQLGVVLNKHKYWVETNGKEGQQAELVKFNLQNKNLSNNNLQRANLSGSSFYRANLTNTNLKEAILKGAYFNEANLQNTDLTGADLRFAELKKAVCKATIFSKSRLFKANFEAARIEVANFVDVEIGNSSLIKILRLANIKSILVSA